MRPAPIGVFAVESTTAQVCWASLDVGPVVVTVGDADVRLDWDGGPGGVVVGQLPAGRRLPVSVRHHEGEVYSGTTATLPSLPGEPVARFATLNDVHLGCSWFSAAGIMRERVPPGAEVSANRCARSAVGAALQWGAERLVIKGDLVQRGTQEEWDAAEAIFGDLPVPLDVCLGNHEVLSRPSVLPTPDGLARLGVELEAPVRIRDLPGLRLVIADTAVHGRHDGSVAHLHADLVAAADVDVPVMVFVHHDLEPSATTIPFPRGVRAREAAPLLDDLARINPAVFVATGHTHRHRRHMRGAIPVVEVGSPKDYPGVWCGYEVTTAGVRQVVRRVTGRDCMEWTERTGGALGGFWRRWSPGLLEDRCFIHRWPI
jgi:predicted phosphodiesterase